MGSIGARLGAAGALAALALAAPVAADPPAALPSALEAGWHGSTMCELLEQAQSYRVLRCTFPPGTGHERHFHPANFGYALSGGTMRITDASGTRTVEVATGSHFSSAGTAWHEAVNVGDTTVSYLIVEQLGTPPG